MKSPKTKFCKDAKCPRKGKRLRLARFPHNKHTKDQRTIYCRDCCSRRMRECRERQRAQKQAQKPFVVLPKENAKAKKQKQISTKVYEAVLSGCRTREEIHEATGLTYDVIGDKLCDLMWDQGLVEYVAGEFFPVAKVVINDVESVAA